MSHRRPRRQHLAARLIARDEIDLGERLTDEDLEAIREELKRRLNAHAQAGEDDARRRGLPWPPVGPTEPPPF